MNSIHYQALREAAQNYQSMLAWYDAIPDSPDAEVDCDEALAAFKRQIRYRKWILSPICWMNWKPQKAYCRTGGRERNVASGWCYEQESILAA